MKSRLTLLVVLFNLCLTSFGQEKTSPLTDVTIERFVSMMDIEGKKYENVTVRIKSVSATNSIWGINRVNIKIKSSEGETLWRRTFMDTYLYVFSEGQIQVGKPNFNMIIIYRDDNGIYTGIIREKEGVY